MSAPSSTSSLLTFCPPGPVWCVLSIMPRIFPAHSRTSLSDFTTFTPPPLPRPPAWICAFTTQTLPPSSRAAATASSTDKQRTPRGVATPYLRRIYLARRPGRCGRTAAGRYETAETKDERGATEGIIGAVRAPVRIFHALRARARPGNHEFPRHRVRRARGSARLGAEGVPPAFPAAGLGRARRLGNPQHPARVCARGAEKSEAGPDERRRGRDHQPARDHGRVGPAHGEAGPPRDRLAGPAHRGALRCAEARRPG